MGGLIRCFVVMGLLLALASPATAAQSRGGDFLDGIVEVERRVLLGRCMESRMMTALAGSTKVKAVAEASKKTKEGKIRLEVRSTSKKKGPPDLTKIGEEFGTMLSSCQNATGSLGTTDEEGLEQEAEALFEIWALTRDAKRGTEYVYRDKKLVKKK